MAVGAILFAACLVAPAGSRGGLLVLGATAAGWTLLCRPPLSIVRKAFGFGLVLFVPFALLAAAFPAAGSPSAPIGEGSVDRVLPFAIGVAAKGMATLLVSVATLSTLRLWEFQQGLGSFPLPGMALSILAQMLLQIGTLAEETARIAAVLTLRGGGGRGSFPLVAALPKVWLPRVIARAERTALAMEIRGFSGESPRFESWNHGRGEAGALALSFAWLLASIALRSWS
jgi:energy-coupling factor transporter transmembrane protein EcfT